MILVNVLIFVIFSLFLVSKYDKALIVITIWLPFLDMLILPVSNVTVFGGLLFVALTLYVTRNRRSFIERFKTYPMALCTLILLLSIALTNKYSGNPHWPSSIISFTSVYMLPFLLWSSLTTSPKLQQYIHLLYFCVVVSVLYCFIEVILGRNPIMEWLVSNKEMVGSGVGLSDRFRFGIKRIQGLFALNGALGGFCILNALFFLFLRIQYKTYVSKYKNLPFLIGALILCAFFTGTRSVMIACVIGMIYAINKNPLKNKWTYYLIVIFILIIPFALTYFTQIYMSFADTESIDGSNASMREVQFGLAYHFLTQSFWIGNGIAYTFTDVIPEYPEMCGAESVWIPFMIDQGVIGVTAYAILVLYSLYYCFKLKNRVGFFMILAFLVLKTMTSAPGLNEAYFLIYIVLTSKIIMLQHTKNEML